MCLVGVAVNRHPRYSLIVAGNRDELHSRGAAPADWWNDHPHCYGGRDLVAGGSWLGVSRHGRVAVVTNYPGRETVGPDAPSRGQLVVDFVRGAQTPQAWLADLTVTAGVYAGFCIVVGTATEAAYLASPDPAGPATIADDIFTVSNSQLTERWPKEQLLKNALADPDIEEDDLLDLLARRIPAPADAAHDATGRPARAWTPFVEGPVYGTRASTIVTVSRDGSWRVLEQRFGANGTSRGRSVTEFVVS